MRGHVYGVGRCWCTQAGSGCMCVCVCARARVCVCGGLVMRRDGGSLGGLGWACVVAVLEPSSSWKHTLERELINPVESSRTQYSPCCGAQCRGTPGRHEGGGVRGVIAWWGAQCRGTPGRHEGGGCVVSLRGPPPPQPLLLLFRL